MSSGADPREVQNLRAQVGALEQLLAAHEQAVIDEARHRRATEAKLLEKHEELARNNARLLAEEEAKNAILEQLRLAVEQLSTPILDVWDDVIALPVIGVVDSERAAVMMERLLTHVVENKSRIAILDVTGVEVVDSAIADHLVRMVRAVELLGAHCIVTGLRPAVAQTLASIGVDLGSMTTLRSLRHALRKTLVERDDE